MVAKKIMAFDLLLISFVAQTLTNRAYINKANIIGMLVSSNSSMDSTICQTGHLVAVWMVKGVSMVRVLAGAS